MTKAVRIVLFIMVVSLSGPAADAQAPAPQPPSGPQIIQVDARFQHAVAGQAVFVIEGEVRTLSVPAEAKSLQARLQAYQPGDWLILDVAQDGDTLILQEATAGTIDVTRWHRVGVLLGVALGLLLFLSALFRGNPFAVLIGEDGRYSSSKFQVAVWFFVLIVTYLAALWLRWKQGGAEFIGGVNIPENLLLLSGISAFTFAAAKGITTAKVDVARQSGDTRVKAEVKPEERKLLANLVSNDQGRPDLGDTQMLIIMLVAVGTYFAEAFKFLGAMPLLHTVMLPDVDTTILATFGLGQGAYLTKKYAGRVGEA